MARAKHALRAPFLSIAAIMRYLARTTALGRVGSQVSPPEPAQHAPAQGERNERHGLPAERLRATPSSPRDMKQCAARTDGHEDGRGRLGGLARPSGELKHLVS